MSGAPSPDEDPEISVYDGRTCLGFVFARRDHFLATDPGRRPLGRFATDREASAAIHEARLDRKEAA